MSILSASWRVVGASVAGSRHLKRQQKCEDAMGYEQLPDGTLLVVVADGAGSASHAQEGASQVVQSSLAFARAALDQHRLSEEQADYQALLVQIVDAAHQALGALANDDTPVHAFASTMLFALVTRHWLAVLQVGDGALVVQRTDGTYQTVTHPDQGEFINESSFITESNYREHVQYALLPGGEISGIAMFTDGLQLLALELATNQAYAPFFAPLFTFASRNASVVDLENELAQFLASERVCTRTDDDKTLVLALAEPSQDIFIA